MSDRRSIDEPAPTVVGPQPSERGGGRKVSIPQGLEKLVALAGLGAEWRAKILADPLAAAREAKLELSENERAIIKSVPPEALAGTIDSFRASVPRPSGLGRLAAGAAAAALLAGTLTGCDGCIVKTQGIQPDVPPAKPEKVEPEEKPKEKDVEKKAVTGTRPDVPPTKK